MMRFVTRVLNAFVDIFEGIERRRRIKYQEEWIKRLNKIGQKLFYTAPLIAFPFSMLRLLILLGVFYFAIMEHEPFRQQMERDLRARGQNIVILQFNRQTILDARLYVLGFLIYIAIFSYTLYHIIY